MKTFNAYVCVGIGSNMKFIGAFSTSREARAAAKAAYKAGESAANGLPAGAYAWQAGKNRAMSYAW